MDLVQVEDVRRPAELEHHVVRDVHQRRHRSLAAAGQPVDHPRRRAGLGVDAAHDAAGEAAAQVGRFDPHRQPGVVRRPHRLDVRRLQRRAGQRRDFAGDAVDAERMRQVGRELEREQRVVEAQPARGCRRPPARRRPAPAGRHGRRTASARAPSTACRSFRRRAACRHRSRTACRRRRAAAPRPTMASGTLMPARALGAPQTICSGAPWPALDLAHVQTVGLRVRFGRQDLGHDDAAERRRQRPGVLDLHAGHGQQIGQRRGVDGRVAELAQPGLGKLHGPST